ncbi:MAG: PTS sugar transporter subunit IIA [Deltaproteobacteria bacterium]|nr:PTS sugar transporter subunit IIA [Deltaproteobacteria bacterium]
MKKLIPEDLVFLGLKSPDKAGVINELAGRLSAAGKIHDRAEAAAAVMERENKLSTGVKLGVAFPHGELPGNAGNFDPVVACVGVSDNPVDFDSPDGEPCRIFVLSLCDPARKGDYLKLISEISLLLRDEGVRKAILRAKTPADVSSVLSIP